LLFGIGCAVLALLVLLRLGRALRTGTIPLYRTQLHRSQAGEARFWTLVLLNAAAFVLLFIIAADLLLNLGLR